MNCSVITVKMCIKAFLCVIIQYREMKIKDFINKKTINIKN